VAARTAESELVGAVVGIVPAGEGDSRTQPYESGRQQWPSRGAGKC